MMNVNGVVTFNTENFNIEIVRRAFDGVNNRAPIDEIRFWPQSNENIIAQDFLTNITRIIQMDPHTPVFP